jgi:stage III sporulation protein AA
MIKQQYKNDWLNYLPQRIKISLSKIPLENIEEIRLRVNKPLIVHALNRELLLDSYGKQAMNIDDALNVNQEDIKVCLELMSENSIYAYQEEINQGFITLKGGHRVGICGRVIVRDGVVKNIKNFGGLNIRIAREYKGCSDKIMKYVSHSNGDVFNTIIISPPGCGKTTILRDIARNISNGFEFYKGSKVGIIDERGEIAACYEGVPQNDVGYRTDVLDLCPKIIGMEILLRSMSPQVIMFDEIGNLNDSKALMSILNAGVKIITTAHGYNLVDLKSKKEVLEFIEQGVFDRYIVLSRKNGPGTIEEVLDKDEVKRIYRRSA